MNIFVGKKFRRDLDPDQQTKHIRDRDDFT
jgi:hypothetical protein